MGGCLQPRRTKHEMQINTFSGGQTSIITTTSSHTHTTHTHWGCSRGDYAPCRALGKKTPESTTSPECISPIHAVWAAQFRPRSWRARPYCGQRLLSRGQLVSLPAPGGQLGFDLCSARVLASGAAPGSLGLISAAQHRCAVIVSDAGLLVSTVEESTPAALATDGPADHFQLLSQCRPIICAAPTSRLAQL